MDQTNQQEQNQQEKTNPSWYRPKKKRESKDVLPIRVNGEQYKPENPYKANQYVPDPRQAVCWELYLKSWYSGYPNAAKAALEAGYSKTSAANVTNQPWFRERHASLKRKEFFSKGERNLEKFLDMNYEKVGDDGGITVDIDKARLVADMTKLVVTTLGKDEGYSTKSEISKDVSGTVHIRAVNYLDQAEQIEEPKQAEVIDIVGEEYGEILRGQETGQDTV